MVNQKCGIYSAKYLCLYLNESENTDIASAFEFDLC